MGYALGIGIPALIVGVFAVLIWLVVRAGSKKKKRNIALMSYATSRGYQYVGDDLDGQVEGTRDGWQFSIAFSIVQCSADPSAGVGSAVPRMQRLETVLRMALPQVTLRALIGKPFFRNAIHDPLRGAQPVELGDAAFQSAFRVLAPPGERLEWLDAGARATLVRLDARELRLDGGELSLNLDKMIASPKRLDLALELMVGAASQLKAG